LNDIELVVEDPALPNENQKKLDEYNKTIEDEEKELKKNEQPFGAMDLINKL
jgi:hypothetical protein